MTAAVYFGGVNPVIYFYLFAVDTTTGHVRGIPVIISGMANGKSPGASGRCTSDFPDSGTVTFDYNHIQRSALLLLPSGKVYVAFAPGERKRTQEWLDVCLLICQWDFFADS